MVDSTDYKCSLFCSFYKGEQFIEGYMENVLEQSIFKDIEFIFLDCNSPEDEKSYILPLTDKYNNIKYFKLDEDPGLYAAWNHAVGLCSADIIGNWNIDDRKNSDGLEQLVNTLYKTNVDIAYGLTYISRKSNEKYIDNRMAGKTDAMGNPVQGFSYNNGVLTGNFIDNGGGDNNQTYVPPIIPDDDTEEDPTQLLTSRILGSQFDPTFFANEGGRAGLAEGGMPYEGGIMDLESGRQMYFLGKLVKKATRAVKKIAKSPIGKAALMYFGGNALASKMGGLGGLRGTLFGQAGSRVGQSFIPYKEGLFTKLGLTKGGGSFMPTIKGGITLASVLPALLAGKEEDDFDIDAYYAANQLTPGTTKRQMGSEFDFYNYNLAEGGMPSKEPVAKKTMPLIDMDGQEMDLRAEGGFVPIGRMERADDVPARLSKNEFVFTADAVRNAGEGDIDKGAEVMYNMMKNLESGGEVSEESQGLDGAREMFQTSKRLEEVL